MVSTKQLGNLLRHLGINPTKEELQDLTIQIGPAISIESILLQTQLVRTSSTVIYGISMHV